MEKTIDIFEKRIYTKQKFKFSAFLNKYIFYISFVLTKIYFCAIGR